jgi:hypothetical protein
VSVQDTNRLGKILLVNDSAVQLDQLFRLLDGSGFDLVLAINAERTRRIVQSLLSFSRQHKPCRAQADLNEILERSLELRAYELKTNNITVCREFGDLPRINVDQLIWNGRDILRSDSSGGR